MPILAKKNHLFRWSSFWSWRLCKQGKLSHLRHRKPARIHWKADSKQVTVWCGFWSRGIIGSFFFKNEEGEAVTANGNRYRAMLDEFLFIWQHLVLTGRRYVPHSRSYTRCFAPYFWRSYYQPQSWCHLATSELRFDTVGLLFVGCRQRCYADKRRLLVKYSCTQSIMCLKIGPIM